MVAYSKNEMIPLPQFAQQFGKYISQIKENTIDKLALLTDDQVEAVVVSREEYERMNRAAEELENQEIYKIVEERLSEPYETISHDEMLRRLDIDPSELKD